MKVVSGLELSDNFICQYPEFASSFVKYFAPASFPRMTSTEGKCIFSAPKIKFLGNEASANGIEADPDKITAILNLPAPSNVHDVSIFLGMVNHMGKFAEHLADRTKSLSDLVQKESQWIWGPPQ